MPYPAGGETTKALVMPGPDPLQHHIGRPTMLDALVSTDDNGQARTAGDHVLARLAQGLSVYDAALGAAITRGTVDHWCRAGAQARIRELQGFELTDQEQRYMAFLIAYERVQADIEAARLGRIIQVADGGHQRTKIVRRRARDSESGEMVVVEETVTLETAEPNWQANAWILERRFPGKYRRRYDLEVQAAFDDSGEEPEQQARELAASLRAYQQGIIDASSTELATGDQ